MKVLGKIQAAQRGKIEIRNSKSETNSKTQARMVRTKLVEPGVSIGVLDHALHSAFASSKVYSVETPSKFMPALALAALCGCQVSPDAEARVSAPPGALRP
jgi:hypothetical protein